MGTYQDIESAYLMIEPLDNAELDKFYHKYKGFFDSFPEEDDDKNINKLRMLIDIACSYSFSNKHKEAISLIKHVKKHLQKNQIQSLNKELNNLCFFAGNSNLELKKYRSAFKAFYTYKPTDQEKPSIDLLIKLCRDKMIHQALFALVIFGLASCMVKYATKWFLPQYYKPAVDKLGWLSGLVLISYELMKTTLKQKKSA